MVSEYILSETFIDKVIEYAEKLRQSKEFEQISGSISIYTESELDDIGRQIRVDIRAYYTD